MLIKGLNVAEHVSGEKKHVITGYYCVINVR